MSRAPSADARALFEAFHAAESAPAVLAAFAALVEAAPGPPHADYVAFHAWLAPQLAYRQSTYLALVHARWQRAAPWRARAAPPTADSEAAPTRILISGAGPCGLRAACEAAVALPRLAGRPLEVHVVELRTECTRHNVLKMWQPTFDDLVGWGVLVCAPFMQTQQRHGHLHLATRGVQLCLLKAALLLGVRVHWGYGVCGLVDRQDGWHAWLLPSHAARAYLHATAHAIDAAHPGADAVDVDTNVPEEQVQLGGEKDVSRLEQLSRVDYVERAASQRGAVVTEAAAAAVHPGLVLLPVDTLLVAEGEASRMIRRCGFHRHVMRYGEAIGIIVNLDATTTTATTSKTVVGGKERVLPEFVIQRMAADWRASCLGPLFDQGIDLENLEYMRGAGTHFIAATTKTAVLHRLGVIRARLPTTRASLAPDNVDEDALRRLARAIATAVGVPTTSPLCAQHGAQLFDYSCKGVCTEPLRWLDSDVAPTDWGDQRRTRRLPVLPVGDALQNPYWPQGLGVNRGFHTAVDAVWMAYLRVTTGDDATAELERAHAFRTMQWRTFSPALVQPGAQWQVDPLARYAAALQQSMHIHDLEHRAPAPSVPARYRDALGLVWPSALS